MRGSGPGRFAAGLTVLLAVAASCGDGEERGVGEEVVSDDRESTDENDDSDDRESTDHDVVSVFNLKQRTCFGDFSAGSVSELERIDCDEPHANEVFALFDSQSDDEFPGDDELNQEAFEGCTGERFEDYVGTSYAESRWYVDVILPTEGTWEERDDREIICYLHLEDGSEVDESAQDSNE